jgi:hypothetical protein
MRRRSRADFGRISGEGRSRTGDPTVFSRVLYQLSYLALWWCEFQRIGHAAKRRAVSWHLLQTVPHWAREGLGRALDACGDRAWNRLHQRARGRRAVVLSGPSPDHQLGGARICGSTGVCRVASRSWRELSRVGATPSRRGRGATTGVGGGAVSPADQSAQPQACLGPAPDRGRPRARGRVRAREDLPPSKTAAPRAQAGLGTTDRATPALGAPAPTAPLVSLRVVRPAPCRSHVGRRPSDVRRCQDPSARIASAAPDRDRTTPRTRRCGLVRRGLFDCRRDRDPVAALAPLGTGLSRREADLG